MNEFVMERWVYGGRRQTSDGKLAGLWIDADGNEMMFKGTHRSVGASYDVEVLREGDGVSARLKGASFVASGNENDPKVREWIAEDRTAYTADGLRKLEAEAKRDDGFGSLTLDEVQTRMFNLAPMRRTAFLAQVLRYIGA